MKVKIKRVDKSLPLPEYKTEGAAAFDLYAREETTIPAKGWALIPSNLIIGTPEGHVLVLSARSSLAKHHTGLFLANGVGLVDSDYSGNNDEIKISVYNLNDTPITVSRGDRVAQGRFKKFERADWEEVEEMNSQDRGGFGSTGLQ
tara:strand:+ start:354 stop:791 length:438 start_codon:yes stop_codon:yes gene_type:complete